MNVAAHHIKVWILAVPQDVKKRSKCFVRFIADSYDYWEYISVIFWPLQQVSVHNVNGGVGRGFGVEFAQKPAAKKNLQKWRTLNLEHRIMSAELQLSKSASAKTRRPGLRNCDPAVSRSAISRVRMKNKEYIYFKNVILVFFSVHVEYCPSG